MTNNLVTWDWYIVLEGPSGERTDRDGLAHTSRGVTKTAIKSSLMAELRIIAPAIGRSICLEPVARRGGRVAE